MNQTTRAIVDEKRDAVQIVRLLTPAEVREFIAGVPESALSPAGTLSDGLIAVDRTVRAASAVNESDQPAAFVRVRSIIETRLARILVKDNVERLRMSRFNFIQYRAGDFMSAHHDAGPDAYGYRRLTMIAYLSGDFVGGETGLPNLDITVRPPIGAALVFPSTYLHEGRRVESGVKKILQFFLGEASLSPEIF